MPFLGSNRGRDRTLRLFPARLGSALPEALEPRQLLTTAAPDIAMLGATTPDSRQVVFDYRIDAAGLDHPVQIGVYRSADDRFDSTDEPIAATTLRPAGSAGESLDLAGQPALAAGAHQAAVAPADGLPINPARPYVLVVANPDPAATPPGHVASFRKHTLAVITHGGVQPRSWKQVPWQMRMAEGLRQQGYDQVVPFNWIADSRNPGAAARQGRRLEREIVAAAAAFPAGDPVDVHLIGHSQGAVVNSQAVERLNRDGWPAGMQAGYLKVTMLDPHAANNSIPGPQYSVTRGFLGWVARQTIDHFQKRANDPPVTVPENVDSAEVFYQRTPVSQTHTSNHGLYNLWGQVPVRGAAKYFDLTAPGLSHGGHFGVPDWYQLNVVPKLGDGAPGLDAVAISGSQVVDTSRVPTLPGRASLRAHEAVFAGQAGPGATVRILAAPAGNNLLVTIGRTTAGSDGTWTLRTRPLAPGRYRVVARSDAPGGRRSPLKPTAWFAPLVINRPPPPGLKGAGEAASG